MQKNINPFKEILLPYQWKIFSDLNPFIISKISRQCGKSTTFAAKAVYKSIMNEDNLVLLVSVNQRSADELLRKVKQWAEACKIASDSLVDYTETASSVTFSNKSRIISVPASPSSLRGWSGDVILDEYAIVEDDNGIFQAVLPVITSKMKGQQHSLWICSTPSSLDTLFAKIWNTDDDKWHKYEFNIYDCVSQGLKADPDVLKSVVNDDLIWNTEYMVLFASGAGTAFPTEWTSSWTYDALPAKDVYYYLGFDVGRHNDYSAACILAYDLKSKTSYIDLIIKLKGMPYNLQLEEVRKMHARYQFKGGLVDQCGIGSMLAEEITRTVTPKIRGFTWSSANKTDLYDSLRTTLQDSKIKCSKQHDLLVRADFGNVRRYISNTGKIAYSAPHNADGHSDVTSAVVLALLAVHDNPVNATLPTSFSFNSAFGSRMSRL